LKRSFALAVAVTGFSALASASYALECPVSVDDPFDLDEAGVVALYDCLKDAMAEGYAANDDPIGKNFRNWIVTSTRPAVAGPHGNRVLQTFANPVAAEQYLKYADDGFVMPVGSVLAKESISISTKKKTGRVGPLFIMKKLPAGSAPEANDWLYIGLQPNGKPMKFKQSFCSSCHDAWDTQDSLAYPLEEVRISSQ